MRRGAAYRVQAIGPYQQIVVGACVRERIITRQAKLGVGLPPPIRGANDFRVQGLVQFHAHPGAAMRRFEFDPIARFQSLRLSRLGRKFDAWMRLSLPKRWNLPLLGMTEIYHFGGRKHERERVIPRQAVDVEEGNGRLSFSLKKLVINLHLTRFCGESGYFLAIRDSVFSVLGFQWPTDTLRLCSEL